MIPALERVCSEGGRLLEAEEDVVAELGSTDEDAIVEVDKGISIEEAEREEEIGRVAVMRAVVGKVAPA